MTILESIVKGDKLPEVPFSVTVDDHSIAKIGTMLIVVVVICLLIASLLRHKK